MSRETRVRKYGSEAISRERHFIKMANAEENTSDNLALLDVTAVNEGTVVELLRKRYTDDKIYVS